MTRRATLHATVLAACAVAALLALPLASAHAELKSSDPPSGHRYLESPPTAVVLVFTEPIDAKGSSLQVTDLEGHRVDACNARVAPADEPTMTVGLKPLGPGGYLIAWSVLSAADGHATSGHVGFAVGDQAAPASASSDPGRVDATTVLARATSYAGLAIGVAAALFAGWMRQGAAPGIARRMLIVGAALHLAGLALLIRQTALASANGLDCTSTAAPLSNLLQTSTGGILEARFLLGAGALVLAVLVAAKPTRSGPWAVGGLLLLAGTQASRLGHVSPQGPAEIGIDFVHLVAAGTWTGGLLVLAFALPALLRAGAGEEARRLGIRFGSVAMVMVILLAATGLVLSGSILGRDAILEPTAALANVWGVALLAKVALAVAMVALAALNRYFFLEGPRDGRIGKVQGALTKATRGRLRPGLADGSHLRRTVAIEAMLGVAVLLAAGLLTSVSPPAAVARAGVDSVEGQGKFYAAKFTFDAPPQAGRSGTIQIDLVDAATGAVVANNTCGRSTCIQLSVSYAGLNGTEDHVAAPHGGPWYVHDIVWGPRGQAQLLLDIQTAEHFDDVIKVSFTVA